ncbi:MAG: MFS transporter [Planctomycetota bacterium]|jgi:predicted MFS family arabinose efflux permease
MSARQALDRYLASFRGLPREVWILASVGFVHRSGLMVLPFLTIYATTRLGASAAQAGLLLGAYGVGSLIGNGAGGWLTDRIGQLRVQAGSLAFAGAMFFGLGQLTDLVWLGLGLFLTAAVGEMHRPANNAAIATYCPESDHPRAYALHRLAINAGVTIGPALGGQLAAIEYSWLFPCNGLFLASSAVLLLARGRGWQPAESATADVSDEEHQPRVRSPLEDRPLLAAIFFSFLSSLVFFQLMSTLPLYMNEQWGLGEDVIGLLFAVNTVTIILVELPLTSRLQRRSALRMVAVGTGFVGVGFGLMPFGAGVAWAAVSILVWTVGEILMAPFLVSFIASRAHPSQRGRAMGLLGMSFGGAHALGPAIGTWAYGAIGPNAPWYGAWLLGGLACAGFWVLERRLRPASPESA